MIISGMFWMLMVISCLMDSNMEAKVHQKKERFPDMEAKVHQRKERLPGCYFGNIHFTEGNPLIPNPDRPCDICYCIRNRTVCTKKKCNLKIEGCTPVYTDECCPVRYNCYDDEVSQVSIRKSPNPAFSTIFTNTEAPTTSYLENEITTDEIKNKEKVTSAYIPSTPVDYEGPSTITQPIEQSVDLDENKGKKEKLTSANIPSTPVSYDGQSTIAQPIEQSVDMDENMGKNEKLTSAYIPSTPVNYEGPSTITQPIEQSVNLDENKGEKEKLTSANIPSTTVNYDGLSTMEQQIEQSVDMKENKGTLPTSLPTILTPISHVLSTAVPSLEQTKDQAENEGKLNTFTSTLVTSQKPSTIISPANKVTATPPSQYFPYPLRMKQSPIYKVTGITGIVQGVIKVNSDFQYRIKSSMYIPYILINKGQSTVAPPTEQSKNKEKQEEKLQTSTSTPVTSQEPPTVTSPANKVTTRLPYPYRPFSVRIKQSPIYNITGITGIVTSGIKVSSNSQSRINSSVYIPLIPISQRTSTAAAEPPKERETNQKENERKLSNSTSRIVTSQGPPTVTPTPDKTTRLLPYPYHPLSVRIKQSPIYTIAGTTGIVKSGIKILSDSQSQINSSVDMPLTSISQRTSTAAAEPPKERTTHQKEREGKLPTSTSAIVTSQRPHTVTSPTNKPTRQLPYPYHPFSVRLKQSRIYNITGITGIVTREIKVSSNSQSRINISVYIPLVPISQRKSTAAAEPPKERTTHQKKREGKFPTSTSTIVTSQRPPTVTSPTDKAKRLLPYPYHPFSVRIKQSHIYNITGKTGIVTREIKVSSNSQSRINTSVYIPLVPKSQRKSTAAAEPPKERTTHQKEREGKLPTSTSTIVTSQGPPTVTSPTDKTKRLPYPNHPFSVRIKQSHIYNITGKTGIVTREIKVSSNSQSRINTSVYIPLIPLSQRTSTAAAEPPKERATNQKENEGKLSNSTSRIVTSQGPPTVTSPADKATRLLPYPYHQLSVRIKQSPIYNITGITGIVRRGIKVVSHFQSRINSSVYIPLVPISQGTSTAAAKPPKERTTHQKEREGKLPTSTSTIVTSQGPPTVTSPTKKATRRLPYPYHPFSVRMKQSHIYNITGITGIVKGGIKISSDFLSRLNSTVYIPLVRISQRTSTAAAKSPKERTTHQKEREGKLPTSTSTIVTSQGPPTVTSPTDKATRLLPYPYHPSSVRMKQSHIYNITGITGIVTDGIEISSDFLSRVNSSVYLRLRRISQRISTAKPLTNRTNQKENEVKLPTSASTIITSQKPSTVITPTEKVTSLPSLHLPFPLRINQSPIYNITGITGIVMGGIKVSPGVQSQKNSSVYIPLKTTSQRPSTVAPPTEKTSNQEKNKEKLPTSASKIVTSQKPATVITPADKVTSPPSLHLPYPLRINQSPIYNITGITGIVMGGIKVSPGNQSQMKSSIYIPLIPTSQRPTTVAPPTEKTSNQGKNKGKLPTTTSPIVTSQEPSTVTTPAYKVTSPPSLHLPYQLRINQSPIYNITGITGIVMGGIKVSPGVQSQMHSSVYIPLITTSQRPFTVAPPTEKTSNQEKSQGKLPTDPSPILTSQEPSTVTAPAEKIVTSLSSQHFSYALRIKQSPIYKITGFKGIVTGGIKSKSSGLKITLTNKPSQDNNDNQGPYPDKPLFQRLLPIKVVVQEGENHLKSKLKQERNPQGYTDTKPETPNFKIKFN